MAIEIVRGCIFEGFERGDINYLVHQVNCIGAFGGLAGEVGRRYPAVYDDYMYRIRSQTNLLGQYQHVRLEPDKYIINIFGQQDIGTNKRQTNYGALPEALVKFRDDRLYRVGHNIGFPYKFASNLAGADWTIVLEMIEFIFRDHNVKIYQL